MRDDWNWVGPDCHRIELMDWRIGNGLIQIANRLALGWRWVDLDWHRIDHGLGIGIGIGIIHMYKKECFYVPFISVIWVGLYKGTV